MALATRGPPPGLPKQVPPSQTLYINNLPDKIRKDDLKKSLYMLFATYGVVLEVNLMGRTRMRGQAHVVFRDTDTSTQAMRALQGASFFGNEMKIQYAKKRSETIAKLDGTLYEQRAKPVQEEAAQPSDVAAAVFGGAPGTAPVRKLQPVNVPQEKPAPADEEPKGVKRARDEEEEEEDDDDEDAAMDVSDSD
ncbi:hypothetical protein BDV96DRAFT_649249 [Lophiotrema nucula]|uniref:RRM domain-containing protein n=1 Tax=Lophiotrema nucula TaxID=690887 RepID=A0A6A5YZ75_9PLEO|nr:hypothetical protein BDV96DRAFT_649249 [Lophiotrema nucula]